LCYGLYILDGKILKFNIEKAIWGIGNPDIAIVINLKDEVIIPEFGHMIGLSDCDNINCVMKWECPTNLFCDDCINNIEELWNSN